MQRKRGGRRSRGPLGGRLQAKTAYVTMKYSQEISMDPAIISGTASYHFRANSIYDPDESGTGHQPYMHDTYQQLYNHYEVVSSRIVVRVYPNIDASAAMAITTVGLVSSTGDRFLDLESFREASRGQTMFTNHNSTPTRSIKARFSKRSSFGSNSPEQTGANFGSNPAALRFFRVTYGPAIGIENVGAGFFAVDIYYRVRLSEPIIQNAS